MIIKRTIGVSAGKALAYDYGPGRAQEHHRPHRVAGRVWVRVGGRVRPAWMLSYGKTGITSAARKAG